MHSFSFVSIRINIEQDEEKIYIPNKFKEESNSPIFFVHQVFI